MPDAGPQRERSTKADRQADRQADHAAISRLADDLLPALIAKLGTTKLGELEVREDDWHVRLRRPYGSVSGEGRRATDKASRSQPGHEGHGHARAAPEGHRGSRATGGGVPAGATAGTGAAAASNSTNGTGVERTGGARDDDEVDRSRSIATSPAVGIFQPGPRAASGTRVRAGDSLGTVNVLGVPQEVIAPADAIVGETLVESGMAVEYGQDLIRLELVTSAEAR